MNGTMTKKTYIYPGGTSDVGIRPTVRPLPYFSADPQRGERELAASLRQDFRSLVARRLPRLGSRYLRSRPDTVCRLPGTIWRR